MPRPGEGWHRATPEEKRLGNVVVSLLRAATSAHGIPPHRAVSVVLSGVAAVLVHNHGPAEAAETFRNFATEIEAQANHGND